MGRRGWWALGLIALGEVVLATWVGPVLAPPARRLLLWAWVPLVLWLTEAVPLGVAALLIPVGAVVLGVASEREAFGSFADPVIFLFLGSFLVARALERHGAAAWIAGRVVTLRFFAGGPYRMTLGIGLTAFGLSMWLSNTATAATLLPVVAALGRYLPDEAIRQRFYKTALLLVAYGASIGGTATPIGTPPNLIALGLLERLAPEVPRPSFVSWVGIAFPIALTLFLLVHAWLYVRWLRHVPWEGVRLDTPVASLSPAGRRVLGAFAVLVILWFLPGILQWTLPAMHPFREFLSRRWPESIPPVLIAAWLFWMPARPKQGPLLERADIARIDWDTLLLFGGGLSLGTLLYRTGLLHQVLEALTGTVPWNWGIALLSRRPWVSS
ncbi:MAG: SLC13 family permease [Acidobacteria bacterium]|nr:SLC13 family permease [Acidobacteriota bacterium]MDW7984902.1 SLC13 family permease [Acidobacteriota bacterium]